MIDFVIEDRDMIIEAVLEGILSAEHITEDELFEIEENLFEAICDQESPFACWETIQ